MRPMMTWCGILAGMATVGLGGCVAGEVGTNDSCGPARCEQRGANCGGVVMEGCGVVQCGQCPEGESCGGGGTPNVCGVPSCTGPDCDAAPSLTITSPADGATVDEALLTVSGTAFDDVAVERVEVRVGSGAWVAAAGTTTWSATVTLSSGANTVSAKATDTSGKVAEKSVSVTYLASPEGPITVNSDKTISIGGKKTFPILMYCICADGYDGATVEGVFHESCPASLSKNTNTTIGIATFNFAASYDEPGYSYFSKNIPLFEGQQVFWTAHAYHAFKDFFRDNFRGSPTFAGYYQFPDEPTDGTEDCSANSEETCVAKNDWGFSCEWKNDACYRPNMTPAMVDRYNKIKADEPNRLVYATHWKNMKVLESFADVVIGDLYTHSDRIAPTALEDFLFAKEHGAWNFFIRRFCADCEGFDALSKPVWIVSEAHGLEWKEGSATWFPLTAEEARADAYMLIAMGAKGFGWWNYKSANGVDASPGLVRSEVLAEQYSLLAEEIRSLEPILLLPTQNYSWGGYRIDDRVTFSLNPTRNVYWKDRPSLNYMLKQDGNTFYLFVVNKAKQSIANTTITIAGLTGSMTAKTIGRLGSGSSQPGRSLPVTNGQLVDSFDGYAVHIYEVK